MMKKPSVTLLCLVILLVLTGCASIPASQPKAPQVEVESVKAIKLGLTRQELVFRLKISNPNEFDLPLQTLNFIASMNDTEVAQGMSNERVTIPANDTEMLDVHVSARIGTLLGTILRSASNNAEEIPYVVRGFVKLANWPTRIPFNVDGTVETSAGEPVLEKALRR